MVMHCTAEDAENQKQKHSDGSQKTGGTGLPRLQQTIASIVSVKNTALRRRSQKKPKQQRIEAKADRADTERIILDVYRPALEAF